MMGLTDQCEFITDMTHLEQPHTHAALTATGCLSAMLAINTPAHAPLHARHALHLYVGVCQAVFFEPFFCL